MVFDPDVAGHAQVGAGKGCGVCLPEREEVDRLFTYELGPPGQRVASQGPEA